MGPYPTPTQIRDRKIKDLSTLLINEKNARRNDREEFCREREKLEAEVKGSRAANKRLKQLAAKQSKRHDRLSAKYKESQKRVAKLEDELVLLKGRAKKDSSNSSKPPSSDGFGKTRRTFSTREKSGRKQGGQFGHTGCTMEPVAEDRIIIEVKDGKCECGGEIEYGEAYNARVCVDVEIKVATTEARVFKGHCKACGKTNTAAFPKEFPAPLSYGSNIRSLAATLNEFGNVSDSKTAEILCDMTGGRISVSSGTVAAIRADLAKRLAPVVKDIKQALINCKVLCVDETGVRVNGKLHWTSIYANKDFTLFEHDQKRGSHCDDSNGLLLLFSGILLHDHFKKYYKLTMSHAECDQHILRYLLAVTEIQAHAWAKKMSDFLKSTNLKKHNLIELGGNCFTPEELTAFRSEYTAILDEGDSEYQSAIAGLSNIRRFNEERCLLARLRKYADEHLRFIYDFAVHFGNHLAEQGAGFFKTKQRASGGFRSDKGADDHAIIASVVATARKQVISVFGTFNDAFIGNPVSGFG
ncbi:MAG: IS66 family transposase [Clostridiales bacterium]|jgi:hypothetical protein|nr:IS66 family transposase [Clostridiales bacterium]